jgi:hypothetical protein
MKKLIVLILCLLTFTSFSQTNNVLTHTQAFKISKNKIECDGSWYESIKIENLTNHDITLSFDVESYWSDNPTQATTGDEVYEFTLKPNETISGNCNNKNLLKWSSGPMTRVCLTKLEIINLKYSN